LLRDAAAGQVGFGIRGVYPHRAVHAVVWQRARGDQGVDLPRRDRQQFSGLLDGEQTHVPVAILPWAESFGFGPIEPSQQTAYATGTRENPWESGSMGRAWFSPC
jgi:hypothetical protein